MRTAQMRTVSTTSPAAISRWKRLFRILSRPGANPFALASRSLAQVRSEPFSELWFTAAVPAKVSTGTNYDVQSGPFVRSEGITGIGGNRSDHKPPDERTVKLGKSRLPTPCKTIRLLTLSSPENTLTTSTKYSDHTITARDHLSQHLTTPVPFYSSSSARGQGKNSLQSSTMDSTSRMGSCPNYGQC